jgi:EmrB/QacA subfamily drug resistance transporter
VTAHDAELPTAPPTRPALSPRMVLVVFFGILLGTTLSGLDAAIVATAAPTIIGELGDLSLLPWLTTAYLLAQTTTMPVYGKLGDIYRRKRMFIIAIVTFLIGSALCGLSSSMAMLIACRAIQGIGAGGITGLGMALVADLVPSEKLGRYLGYTGLVFAVTSVLGPFVGGLFVDHLSWRWAFYINVPLGAVCLVSLLWQPAQAVIIKHRIDVLGALLLGGGVTCLLLALSHSGDMEWGSPRTIGLLTAFVVGIGLFVVWEGRVAEPLLPLRILASRITALCTFANLVAGVGFTCGIIYPPIFFQAVTGVDASRSGLLLAPFAFTCAVSTLVAGQLTDRVGGYKVIPLVGMVCLGVGYGLLGTIDGDTSAAAVMGFAMIGGIGVGFVMQTLLFVVQRSSTTRDMGVATSTVMLFRVMGSSLGVAVLGSAFTSSLSTEVEERLPGFPTSEVQGAPEKIAAMAPEVREHLQEAFALSLGNAFKVAVPFMIVGFLAVLAIPGRAVKRRMAEAHAVPVSADTVAHPA